MQVSTRFRGWVSSLRPGRRPARIALKGLLAAAALAALWTLAIGVLLPRWLQPRLEAQAAAALGAPLTMQTLELSPWTLRSRVTGLQLGPPGAPWLAVAAIEADVSIESLWRGAPVLRRLTVLQPRVEFERLAPDHYNVSPLIEALQRPVPPPEPGAEPQRFAVHNILIEDGELHAVDRVGGGEHRVSQLRLGIPFLSNLPSQLAIEVEPQLDATVDGSALHLSGRAQPFSDGRRAALELRWQQIDLARALASATPWLPQPLPVALKQGRLDLALNIAFERAATASEPPSLQITGSAALAQVQASLPAQGAQVAWQRLAVDGLSLQPLQRRLSVGTVTWQAPAVELDLPRLLAPSATPAAAAKAPPPAAEAWQWRVDRVELADGRVRLQHPAWPAGEALTPVTATLTGLGSGEGARAAFTLGLADTHGARVTLDGTVALAARQASLRADLAGLQPAAWLAPWQALLPVRLLGGTAAAQARAEVDAQGWRLREGAVQLTGVALQPAAAAAPSADDRLALAKADVCGIELQSGAANTPSARVAAVQLDGLDLKAARRADGSLGWLPAPAAAASSAAAKTAAAPRWQLDELRCRACAVAVTDRRVSPAVALAVGRTDLLLRHLGSDPQPPIEFDVTAGIGRSGSLKARGSVRPQPLELRSRLDLAALELGVLQPYLDPHVNLTLTGAKLSAAGELRIDGTAAQAVSTARWRGRLALADVQAIDRLNAAEFVRVRALSLDGADLGWRPAGLDADLGSIVLDGFYGRVIINSDGRLNLRDIVRRSDAAVSITTPGPAPAPAPAAPAASATGSSNEPPTAIRWRGIRLAAGEIDITDNFIRPNYSARLTGIAGNISALAWNDPAPATVSVTGRVDDSAPLEVKGTVHPLGARLNTDITASARGIDMTRLSAYATRYAGYGIEKGTLTATVHYRIADGRLEAENSLYLDQLTFGQKVDSPDALKLPVLLAVALLKDRNGVIDINLPVRGSLDDPQFSIGAVIGRVLVNLIARAVTAPFALLAQAFGGGATQELSRVAFAPGSAQAGASVTAALDTLAKAMLDRPALRLEITGEADPAQDGPALQQAHLDRLMRMAKAAATGTPSEAVQVPPEERGRWLTAAYQRAEIPGKPRNLIGLQKTLPPAEMEALLLTTAPTGTEPLRALADRRADHVKAYLAAKVPSERLLLTASSVAAPDSAAKEPATAVRFSLR